MIPRNLIGSLLFISNILIASFSFAVDVASDNQQSDNLPVKVLEDQTSFYLSNDIVSARISKRSGNIISIKYHGLDLLDQGRGYWSFVGNSYPKGPISGFAPLSESKLSIDPKQNGGARGEIVCIFSYGKSLGKYLPADVEMRYSLGRGEQWIYTYSIWNHKSGYPAFSLAEARYALKLNPDVFDYLTVDANRRRLMPSGSDWDNGVELNMKEVRRLTSGVHAGEVEHKYSYSAMLSETPAYGWSSSKHNVGLWLINPSLEYVAGGPTKVELTGHLDCNPGGMPTLLNMWLGSHYGGSSFGITKDEEWSKIIGPFLLYCNSAKDQDAMWADAIGQAAKESKQWPYDWVSTPLYPLSSMRGTASGQITINDPLDQNLKARNIQVGLTSPDYTAVSFRKKTSNALTIVDWQRNAKHYQFWTKADSQRRFVIPNVRPGVYTLHAIADGVLGEFCLDRIEVAAGDKLDLGTLSWIPKRFGKTVWEIGIPDRSAAEFRHGDEYWNWGLYYQYPKDFPNDVNFVIGKSDWQHDWNYCQPPKTVGSNVYPTTWSIRFDMPEVVSGQAVLRLGICGSASNNVAVSVNDKNAGETGRLPQTGVMHWDGIRGYWCERNVPFDASLLNKGTNVIRLSFPVYSWRQGVLYDYLRLEIVPGK